LQTLYNKKDKEPLKVPLNIQNHQQKNEEIDAGNAGRPS